jgi:hypothetical protein
MKKGDEDPANTFSSGIPANRFGLEQEIKVDPISGRSNLVYWLEKRGIESDAVTVLQVFEKANASDHIMTEQEILDFLGCGKQKRNKRFRYATADLICGRPVCLS